MQGRRRPGFEHLWRSMDDAGPVRDRHRHGAVQRHTAAHGHATRSIGTLRLRRLDGRSVISLLDYCDHPPGFEYGLADAGRALVLALARWRRRTRDVHSRLRRAGQSLLPRTCDAGMPARPRRIISPIQLTSPGARAGRRQPYGASDPRLRRALRVGSSRTCANELVLYRDSVLTLDRPGCVLMHT
jgi:DNA-binding HxlR family transcriptional regulator